MLIGAAFYFLPTIIAVLRKRHNTLAIFAVNLLFGWSLIGWVIALIWALSSSQPIIVAGPTTVVIENRTSIDNTVQGGVAPPVQQPPVAPPATDETRS